MRLHNRVYVAEYPGQREAFHRSVRHSGVFGDPWERIGPEVREPGNIMTPGDHMPLHRWVTENVGWGSPRRPFPDDRYLFDWETEIELRLSHLRLLELAINLDQLPPTKPTWCSIKLPRDTTYDDHHQYQKDQDLRMINRAYRIIEEEGLRVFYGYQWFKE